MKEIDLLIIKTIQAFLCMYNPDTIVLYGENISSEIPKIIRERYLLPIEKIMLNNIVLSTDLNADFEAGIKDGFKNDSLK